MWSFSEKLKKNVFIKISQIVVTKHKTFWEIISLNKNSFKFSIFFQHFRVLSKIFSRTLCLNFIFNFQPTWRQTDSEVISSFQTVKFLTWHCKSPVRTKTAFVFEVSSRGSGFFLLSIVFQWILAQIREEIEVKCRRDFFFVKLDA